VPGRTPHPRRTSHSHSYGQSELNPTAFPPDQWQRSKDYLYGIDLYNHAYWWESHEIFEGLWKMAGRHTEQGNFFQALIQLAAANLKLFMGNRQAAQNLLQRGLIRLQRVPAYYMGMDVARLTEDVRQRVNGPEFQAPLMCVIGLTRIG
jgi:predicted metal-dependent hydrolase